MQELCIRRCDIGRKIVHKCLEECESVFEAVDKANDYFKECYNNGCKYLVKEENNKNGN